MNTNLITILKCLCDFYKIEPKYLFYTSRKRNIVLKRQVFMYLAVYDTQNTLMNIKDFIFQNSSRIYDHTTIIYSSNKIKNELQVYEEIKNDIDNIRQMYFNSKLIPNDVNLLEMTVNYTNSFI